MSPLVGWETSCCSLLQIVAGNAHTIFHLIDRSAPKNSLYFDFPNGFYTNPSPHLGGKSDCSYFDRVVMFGSQSLLHVHISLSLGEVAKSQGVTALLLQRLRELR